MATSVVFKEHEIVKVFPRMTELERVALKNSIKENGLSTPIVVWRDPEDKNILHIVDGRHRYSIIQELIAEGITKAIVSGEKIEVKWEEFFGTESEALRYATTHNGPARRNCTSAQIAASVVKSYEYDYRYRCREAKERGEGKPEYVNISAKELAEATGTNRTYIFNCQAIYHVDKSILDCVINGEASLQEAKVAMARKQQGLPPWPTEEELASESGSAEATEVVEVQVTTEESQPEAMNGLKCLVAPEHVEIFMARDNVREIVKSLNRALADMEAYAEMKGGKLLDGEAAKAGVRSVIRDIKSTQPHVECPYCTGTGKNPDDPKRRCGHCKGAKFLNLLQWKLVPDEMKSVIPDNTKKTAKDED